MHGVLTSLVNVFWLVVFLECVYGECRIRVQEEHSDDCTSVHGVFIIDTCDHFWLSVFIESVYGECRIRVQEERSNDCTRMNGITLFYN